MHEDKKKIVVVASNQGAQADQKMYKTFKMSYLQIHRFPFKNVIFLTIEYKMYLKILSKRRCLIAFQNRPSALMGRDENFVNFEFLEGYRKAFLGSLKEN